jgi:mRNA interferase MazF
VREICLVRLDRTRPALVLTREAARGAMTKVTIAPITSTIKGLSSEVLVGADNGLDDDCAVSLDTVLTVPVDALGRTVGYLSSDQEQLTRAVVLAHDLEVALLDQGRRSARPAADECDEGQWVGPIGFLHGRGSRRG